MQGEKEHLIQKYTDTLIITQSKKVFEQLAWSWFQEDDKIMAFSQYVFEQKSQSIFLYFRFSELLLKLFKLYDNPFGLGNILFEINSLVFCGVVGLSHSSEAFAWPSYPM